ncbi:hypothetical protein C0J52_06851 [Blattella germanica]|nr:hypothetical protein C0J52_06851 [Blattella germanica]
MADYVEIEYFVDNVNVKMELSEYELLVQNESSVASKFWTFVVKAMGRYEFDRVRSQSALIMALCEKIGENASRSPRLRRVYLERGVAEGHCIQDNPMGRSKTAGEDSSRARQNRKGVHVGTEAPEECGTSYSVRKVENGQTVVVEVDEQSLKVLRERGLRTSEETISENWDLKVLQINLKHSKGGTAAQSRLLQRQEADVVLIQELYL